MELESKSNATSNIFMNKENEMKIYVFQPFLQILQIKLNASSPISILNDFCQCESLFFYNGQILDSKKKFAEYKICDNEKIVMIPSILLKSNPHFVDKWLKETKNKENFESKINLRINKANKNEFARLRDLKLFKREMTKKHLKPFNKKENILKYYINLISDGKDNLKIDYMKSNFPSCDPLPILW